MSGAELQGGVDLLEAGVKVQGRLVAEHGVLVEAQHGGEVLDVVDDGAVAGGHPLGHPGGAGGKDDVGGVDVQGPVPDGGQRRLVDLPGGGLGVEEHPAGPSKSLQDLRCLFVAHRAAGVQTLEDQLDAVAGHLLIQGHVVAPGVEDPQERRYRLGVAAHEHHHRLPVIAPLAEGGAQGAGLVVDLTKSQGIGAVGVGGLVRQADHRLLQVGQQIGQHRQSLLFVSAPGRVHASGVAG